MEGFESAFLAFFVGLLLGATISKMERIREELDEARERLEDISVWTKVTDGNGP